MGWEVQPRGCTERSADKHRLNNTVRDSVPKESLMKAQSKRILTAALALGLCIGITACGEDKLADETTAETTAVTTTVSETTAETTVETTAPETEEKKIGINQDLVSEYGQTFAEISAKHGKITDYKIISGGAFYRFETGYGWYYFYETNYSNPSAWGNIENYAHEIPLPDDDFKCTSIGGIVASEFFDRAFETLTIQDIENIEGITLISDGQSVLSATELYCASLTYEKFSHKKTGFTGDNTVIYINHKDEGIVTPDARVEISLWKSFADVYLRTTAVEE